jgi:hypothetical protein
MNTEQIIELQERVDTTPDGWWGPISQKACQVYLMAMMPKDNPWPKPDLESMIAFYGDPWDNSPIISVKAPSWMNLYEGHRNLEVINVDRRCAESLLRALNAAYRSHPDVVCKFYGCHLDRPVRGGKVPSKHAFGCAIDLDALKNRNLQHWPCDASMPIEVMEAFAREGWTPAGAFWNRDAMHFQATQPW